MAAWPASSGCRLGLGGSGYAGDQGLVSPMSCAGQAPPLNAALTLTTVLSAVEAVWAGRLEQPDAGSQGPCDAGEGRLKAGTVRPIPPARAGESPPERRPRRGVAVSLGNGVTVAQQTLTLFV
jgi:hypothetical protein